MQKDTKYTRVDTLAPEMMYVKMYLVQTVHNQMCSIDLLIELLLKLFSFHSYQQRDEESPA